MAEQSFGGVQKAYDPVKTQAIRAGKFGQNVWGNLGKTGTGRVVQRGLAMEYGFYPGQGAAKGYKWMGGAFEGVGSAGGPKAGFAKLGSNLGAKSPLGAIGKTAGKALPMAGAAISAYVGYQQSGIGGAIGGLAESAVYGVAWEAGAAILGGAALPLTIAAGAAAGGAYGYYKFGEAAQKHGRKMRKLEMGTEVHDRFGNVSTLRQRSLMALQNTHVNGRMALGNEAAIMSTPYF